MQRVFCDKCKQEITREQTMELQEIHHVGFTGGYGSAFGDMNSIYLDFCDTCFFKILEPYLPRPIS